MTSLHGLLWQGVSRLLYWSGVGPASAHLWRLRNPNSWTILAYHRVGTPVADGGPDHVSPEHFRQHVRYLRARYEVVTVGEALDRVRFDRWGRRPLLSITFDDGYADNLEKAMPILLEEGCRATLYPTLEAIEEGRRPWTHRLASDLETCVRMAGGGPGDGRTAPPPLARFLERARGRPESRIPSIIQTLVSEAKLMPDIDRRRVCEQASVLAGSENGGRAGMLDAAMLRRWHESGMEVGSHTTDHPIMSRMEPGQRRASLERSRIELGRLLGAQVLHLAYPNGRVGDWDGGTVADARSAGYVSAVTSVEGVNRRDVDPFEIRRMSVGDDALPVLATRVSPIGILLRSGLRGTARRRAPAHATGPGRAGAGAGRPLTIAFIGGRGIGSAYSGIERYYEEIGSRLAERGHRVLAYCRPHFAPEAPVYRGVEVHRLPTVRAKHLETLVHSVLATFDVCFRRVDLVQFHALGSSPLSWIPRLAGKRTVVSVRGLDWQRGKWGRLARAYLRFCETTSVYCPNATAVVSMTLKRHFESRFGRPVRYIPNGVARVEALPPRDISRWGLERHGYFLYAGRLSPEKGLDILIEAHRSVPGRWLVLAGGSSYSEEYMEKLQSSAGEGVVFTGFLTGRPLQEVYAHALAFILPSRMEGLSVALLEALSYGLPVIASDIPENRELVDACGGYLFRLDDVEDLRRLMRSVAASPGDALHVGAQARARVRALFDWDRIADDTVDFYREVMAGSGRAGAVKAPALAADTRPGSPGEGGL